MTSATSQTPKNLRKHIGSAVWLLGLLMRFTPADWTGDAPAWVAARNVVSDAELAERLEVSQETIARWRCRLRAAGVIGWHVAPGQGRAFWVCAVNHIFGVHGEPKSVESKSAGELGAATSEWVQ